MIMVLRGKRIEKEKNHTVDVHHFIAYLCGYLCYHAG